MKKKTIRWSNEDVRECDRWQLLEGEVNSLTHTQRSIPLTHSLIHATLHTPQSYGINASINLNQETTLTCHSGIGRSSR